MQWWLGETPVPNALLIPAGEPPGSVDTNLRSPLQIHILWIRNYA